MLIVVRSVCVALIACNAPSQQDADAAAQADDAAIVDADTAVDADWSVGTIKVTAIDGTPANPGSSPIVGAAVVFTDVTQTQVATTDANGVASVVVTGSTTVTLVLKPFPTAVVARAIIGARPGDDIVFRKETLDYTQRAPITVRFTPTGAQHWACGPCSCQASQTSPITLPMTQYCTRSTADVFLLNQAVGYANALNVPYDGTTGGSVTFSSLTPLTTFSGVLTNIPSNVVRQTFSRHSGGWSTDVSLIEPNSTTTFQLTHGMARTARFVTHSFTTGTHQFITHGADPGQTTYNLDVGSTLLPWLGVPTFDAATLTLNVPYSPTGASPDLFTAFVAYSTPSGTQVEWTLFANAAGKIKLPSLPPSVADVAFMGRPGLHAYFVESDEVSGYEEARLDPHRLAAPFRFGPGRTVVSFASDLF